MKERLFRFKQFSVRHEKSSMKVGVDGVLIGAWAKCNGKRLLDVGSGCGLISLMLAQRNTQAKIIGIDIDEESVSEASENVKESLWADRIKIECKSFTDLVRNSDSETDLFDGIVSNPPFFESGVRCPKTRREIARHGATLSPEVLVKESGKILNNFGALSLIAPNESLFHLKSEAENAHMKIKRICFVRNHNKAPYKRIMIEFVRGNETDNGTEYEETFLTLFEDDGNPTVDYLNLCHEFYLHY